MNGTITPGYYRHYKGKLHKVHFVGLHSETLEPQVCYESLYKNRKSQFWVRPLSMFTGTVTIKGSAVPRFTRVADHQAQGEESAFRTRSRPFKQNAVVSVKAPSYTGYGLVNWHDKYPEHPPANKLPVVLENGNTWWYDLATIAAATDISQWPGWIRRQKRVKP